MKLSEYKKGDRVKYVFLGDYDGVVELIQQTHCQPVLLIKLDKPAPVKFNMGSQDVVALFPSYIELIKE